MTVTDDEIPNDYEQTAWDDLPREVKERVQWAEAFHTAGLLILPVRAGAKEATAVETPLPSVEAIRRCLSSPDGDLYRNFGVRGGDQFVWIDADEGEKRGEIRTGETNLRRLAARYGGLPDTFMARTPSGGLHVLFKVPHPVTNATGNLPPYIDVRGHHGYVVGVGSAIVRGRCKPDDTPGTYRHIGGSLDQIANAPDWLLEHLEKVTARTAMERMRIVSGDYRINGDPAPYIGVRSALSYIDFTMADEQGTWAGACKALFWNQVPIYRENDVTGRWHRIDDESARQLCHEAMSGRLWGQRIGDPNFEFLTYGGPDVLENRIKDRPSRAETGIGLGWFFNRARENGWRACRADMYVPRVAIVYGK